MLKCWQSNWSNLSASTYESLEASSEQQAKRIGLRAALQMRSVVFWILGINSLTTISLRKMTPAIHEACAHLMERTSTKGWIY